MFTQKTPFLPGIKLAIQYFSNHLQYSKYPQLSQWQSTQHKHTNRLSPVVISEKLKTSQEKIQDNECNKFVQGDAVPINHAICPAKPHSRITSTVIY